MGTRLYWKPHKPTEGECLGPNLKMVLEASDFNFSKIYTYTDIEYFRGLRDAGVEEAQEIIDAIEANEEIKLFIR